MRIRHIEIFHAIYRHKTISAAARKLNISQPAVSKALRHAEDQIGFQLFLRTGRGLVPTPQAHSLIADVNKVYASVSTVQRKVQDLRKSINGRLKISTVTGLSFEILPRALARVRKSHPTHTIELQTLHYSDLIASLREFDTHIGLVFEAPVHEGLVRETIGKCEFSCVHQKQEFKEVKQRIPIRDIIKQDVISLNPIGPLGGKLWEEIRSVDSQFEPVTVAESCFVAKSLVACGMGVTIVDEFTANAPGFTDLELAKIDPSIDIEINALYLEARPLPDIASVFLKAFEAELQLWQSQ